MADQLSSQSLASLANLSRKNRNLAGAVVSFGLDDLMTLRIEGQLVVAQEEGPMPRCDVMGDFMRLNVPLLWLRNIVVDEDAALFLEQQRPQARFLDNIDHAGRCLDEALAADLHPVRNLVEERQIGLAVVVPVELQQLPNLLEFQGRFGVAEVFQNPPDLRLNIACRVGIDFRFFNRHSGQVAPCNH